MHCRTILLLSLIGAALAAYEDEKYYRTPPPPRILSHKQAQNHDGGFKFAFAAENGLAQTEVIAPDGSRNGGYTYVDPHGKTITVKYTAGKEGFRILEGEHIPREVQAQAVHSQQQQPGGYYQRPQGPPDDGSYKPEKYEHPYSDERPAPKPVHLIPFQAPAQQEQRVAYKPHIIQEPARQPFYQQQQQFKPAAYAPPPLPRQYAEPNEGPISNAVDTDDPKAAQYNDAPGKPHSFGAGYSFHFSN